MTIITKNIGRLPVNLGDYDSTRAYGRKNRCLQYGCEVESLVENNTDAPFTWDGSETFTLNPNWRLISGNPEVWAAGNPKPAASEDYPYNGMGRVVIPKNMVNIAEQGDPENIVNLLTQAAFEDGEGNPLTNTVFVIQYDFTLGEDITVPANCVLEFDGGSISGGIIYNYTKHIIKGKELGLDVNGNYLFELLAAGVKIDLDGITVNCNPVSTIVDRTNEVSVYLHNGSVVVTGSNNISTINIENGGSVDLENINITFDNFLGASRCLFRCGNETTKSYLLEKVSVTNCSFINTCGIFRGNFSSWTVASNNRYGVKELVFDNNNFEGLSGSVSVITNNYSEQVTISNNILKNVPGVMFWIAYRDNDTHNYTNLKNIAKIIHNTVYWTKDFVYTNSNVGDYCGFLLLEGYHDVEYAYNNVQDIALDRAQAPSVYDAYIPNENVYYHDNLIRNCYCANPNILVQVGCIYKAKEGTEHSQRIIENNYYSLKAAYWTEKFGEAYNFSNNQIEVFGTVDKFESCICRNNVIDTDTKIEGVIGPVISNKTILENTTIKAYGFSGHFIGTGATSRTELLVVKNNNLVSTVASVLRNDGNVDNVVVEDNVFSNISIANLEPNYFVLHHNKYTFKRNIFNSQYVIIPNMSVGEQSCGLITSLYMYVTDIIENFKFTGLINEDIVLNFQDEPYGLTKGIMMTLFKEGGAVCKLYVFDYNDLVVVSAEGVTYITDTAEYRLGMLRFVGGTNQIMISNRSIDGGGNGYSGLPISGFQIRRMNVGDTSANYNFTRYEPLIKKTDNLNSLVTSPQDVGRMVLDSNNKPCWYTGSGWVYADGTPV